jgi:serine/threonine-protein kinase HipA
MIVDRCPSTLKPGFTTYSPAGLRKVFAGKRVAHILPFESPNKSQAVNEAFMENRKRLSISGAQEKISLRLEKNKLRLIGAEEQGQYIFKPIPDDLKLTDQVPANEHLTMQLAEQVFGIRTAGNAMIFFMDNEPGYITRRFDYNEAGSKLLMEDFSTLAGKTRDNAGENFKYEASCEDLFILLKQYVGPYLVEAQKLFRLTLFNYVFSNGDAHLKNFSLLETNDGDFTLSPAYDLICTRIHVNDPDIAFKQGLFAGDFETDSFAANGFYAYDDFYQLGLRAGLPEAIVKREITLFQNNTGSVESLIDRSFLEDDIKVAYYQIFQDKLSRLAYSFVQRSQ